MNKAGTRPAFSSSVHHHVPANLLLIVSCCNRVTKLLGSTVKHMVHRVGFCGHGHRMQTTNMELYDAAFVVFACFFRVDIREMNLDACNLVAVGLQGFSDNPLDVMFEAYIVLNVAVGLELNLHANSLLFQLRYQGYYRLDLDTRNPKVHRRSLSLSICLCMANAKCEPL